MKLLNEILAAEADKISSLESFEALIRNEVEPVKKKEEQKSYQDYEDKFCVENTLKVFYEYKQKRYGFSVKFRRVFNIKLSNLKGVLKF